MPKVTLQNQKPKDNLELEQGMYFVNNSEYFILSLDHDTPDEWWVLVNVSTGEMIKIDENVDSMLNGIADLEYYGYNHIEIEEVILK